MTNIYVHLLHIRIKIRCISFTHFCISFAHIFFYLLRTLLCIICALFFYHLRTFLYIENPSVSQTLLFYIFQSFLPPGHHGEVEWRAGSFIYIKIKRVEISKENLFLKFINLFWHWTCIQQCWWRHSGKYHLPEIFHTVLWENIYYPSLFYA